MSDLFKSTYNPDALSCIATRRRPPPARGQGANAKCPGIWRGGSGVCPVGPSPKVPGRLAGGSVSGGGSAGTGRHPAPHPTWTPPLTQCRRDRLQKGEGYIPLPHHVTPRPSQLKAAQSSKDYCGLT